MTVKDWRAKLSEFCDEEHVALLRPDGTLDYTAEPFAGEDTGERIVLISGN